MNDYYGMNLASYESNSLAHYGVLGMKWGVWNDETRARYSGKNREPLTNKQLNTSSKIAYKTKDITNEASNLSKIAQKRQSKKESKKLEEEMSQMTDKELQQIINRMNLERQYKTLKTQDIDSGYEALNDVLSTVGSVVAIVGGVLTIAAMSKQLKG